MAQRVDKKTRIFYNDYNADSGRATEYAGAAISAGRKVEIMKRWQDLNRFSYSVLLLIDIDSILEYIATIYEEQELTRVDAYNSFSAQLDEVATDFRVRVYGNTDKRQFFDDTNIYGNWYYTNAKEYSKVIGALCDNEVMIFADDRDELVATINAIHDHCVAHNIHGEFGEIIMHNRPIDWEYGKF